MHVTIPGNELILALTGLRKIVTKKTSIPALSHVLVSAHIGSGCTLTGSDLDAYATYRVQDFHGEIINFQSLIPLDALMRLTKSAQRDQVTLNPVSGNRLEVILDGPLGQRKHFLNTLPAEDYPDRPNNLHVYDCAPGLLTAYQKAAPFASTDETRMVLNGVRLDVEDSGVHRIVTTDGRRLCALGVADLPLETSVTLPMLKFLLWNKLEDTCALGVKDIRFQLETGPWTLQSRQIEGQYPTWRHVVPSEPGADSFTLNEEDMPMFREAVQTLPVPYPESSEAPIILREVGGQLELSARDEDGNVTTRVLPTSKVSPGLRVSVNRLKLKEAIDRGFTTWTLCGDMAPLCSRDGDNLHVLMPLRIDGIGPVPVPVEEKSDQTDPSDQTDTPEATNPQPETPEPETQKEPEPMPMIEQEYDPSEADEAPTNVVAFPPPEPQEPETLDDLLVLVQDARTQIRDLNKSLGDIASFIRSQKKQEKQLRTELQNAKGVLEKLRDIAA